MSKKLVLFGTGDIAELAHYYFTRDSEFEVVAFTVDSEFITDVTFCRLPVVPFQNVADHYPPNSYSMFVALAYSKINEIRKNKYLQSKNLGYDIASYISSRATVLNDGQIGENSFILEDNTIQPFVKIGNNVTMWSGNHIGHHSVLGNHVFVSSHVVVSGHVNIGDQCFIGVNATLRDHISIGARCVVGAGTLILSDTESDGLYIGTETQRSSRPSSTLRKI
jgi:sugar O-acyltransferase (sialic acid O-acetyltransferase NeuD family)